MSALADLGWECRALAAEKTVEVLKAKVRALYAGDSTSTIQGQLERSKRRQDEARRRREAVEVRAAELARYNQSLEVEVEDRTRDIRTILDNVTSGFLIVGPDLVVRAGHTGSCHTLFESSEVAGRLLPDLLRLGGHESSHLRLAIDQVFSDILPDEVALALVPQRISIGERIVRLDARAIRDDRAIVAVLLTVNDATSLERAERQASTNHVLIGILRQRSAFQVFVHDARSLFVAAREAATAQNDTYVRRAVHTIKGNAAAFDIVGVVGAIHDIESREHIDLDQLDACEESLRSFIASHAAILDISYDLIDEESYEVSGAAVDALDGAARQEDLREVELWASKLVLKRADLVAGPLAVYVEKLAERLEKLVDFRLTGGEQMIDARALRPVFQNLSHVLRNAVDHGIESPDARGDKPSRGLVEVSIIDEGDHWLIAVADDGRGIDPEKVASRAVEKGFVDAQDVRRMTLSEKARLVFLDGFSTARVATDVSGRGMGMSAVKAAVEQLGGTIAVESMPGLGTRLALFIPKAAARGPAAGIGIGDCDRSRIQVETSLKTVEADPLLALFDASLDAIVTMDGAGAILGWNVRAEELFGWSFADVRDRLASDTIVAEESREAYTSAFNALPRTPRRRLDVIGTDRRGRRLNLELSLTSTTTGSGRVFHGFIRDLSETNRLRDDLVHAQKMETIGRQCTHIAHDFNNSLAVISAFAGLVTDALAEGDPRLEDVLEIVSACEGAARLTRQVLTYGRKEVSDPKLVDAATAVRRMCPMVQRLIGSGIVLRTSIREGAGLVRIDPLQLERLVTNLAANARDAMPNGGTLSITTRAVTLDSVPEKFGAAIQPGQFVVIRLSDTGSGIAADVKDHIFEPFFTTKDLQKGTGFGLSTVFDIARKSGGHVSVESAPGHGTTFEVYIPAIADALAPGRAIEHAQRRAARPGRALLPDVPPRC